MAYIEDQESILRRMNAMRAGIPNASDCSSGWMRLVVLPANTDEQGVGNLSCEKSHDYRRHTSNGNVLQCVSMKRLPSIILLRDVAGDEE